jgi:hypothetical protein
MSDSDLICLGCLELLRGRTSMFSSASERAQSEKEQSALGSNDLGRTSGWNVSGIGDKAGMGQARV